MLSFMFVFSLFFHVATDLYFIKILSFVVIEFFIQETVSQEMPKSYLWNG